jgi:hypothetical protein
MITKTLLSILFSVFWMAGMAQSTFIAENLHVYGAPGDSMPEWGEDINPLFDGDYLIGGHWQSSGLLAKVNDCGDTLWTRNFTEGTKVRFHAAIELNPNAYLAVGDCADCFSGDNLQKGFVVITDSNGLELGRAVIGDTGLSLHYTSLVKTADNGFAATGNTTSQTGCFWANGDIAIFKNDSTIAEEWVTVIDEDDFDVAQKIIQTSDGGYVVTGATWGSNQIQRHAVWRLDASGNLLWDQFFYPYQGFCLSPAPNSVVQMDNGNLAVVGGYFPDSTAAWEGFMLEMRLSDGLVLDSVFMSSNIAGYHEKMFDVKKRPNGNLVVSGQKGGWANFYQPWVLEYSPSFNLISDQVYQAPSQAGRAESIALIPGDSLQYIFCGRQTYIFNGSDLLVGSRIESPALVTFTQQPQHKQLYPRDLNTNDGTATFAGTVVQGTTVVYTDLKLLVYRNDSLIFDQDYPLTYFGNTANFSFDYDFPAELADYTFEIQGVWEGCSFSEAHAEDVVAGDAFIIQGQSNAVATFGGTLTSAQDEYIRIFGKQDANDTLYVWRKELNDPEPFADNRSGNLGLAFAKRIIDEQQIPVAIVNGALGGIPIQDLIPNPSNHRDTSTNYGQLLVRMEKAGLENHVRAIVFFQGETNAWLGLDSTSYINNFATLNTAWDQDYPSPYWNFLFQIRPGCFGVGGTNALHIQEAQRRIPQLFQGWKVISSTAMEHDGCHHTAAGYDHGGMQLNFLLQAYFYNTILSVPDIESMNPIRINFCPASPYELAILYEYPIWDPSYFTPGLEQDFRLEGDTSNHVLGTSFFSGSVPLDSLIVTFTNPIDTNLVTGLSYHSRAFGDSVPLRTSQNIGMLAFFNLPIYSIGPMSCLVAREDAQNSLYDLEIFPNPGQGQYSLQSSLLPPGEVHLRLTDALGKVILEKSLKSNGTQFHTRISIDGASGLYLLQVRHENGMGKTVRVVKE